MKEKQPRDLPIDYASLPLQERLVLLKQSLDHTPHWSHSKN